MISLQVESAPPTWLPAGLTGTWEMLATYPLLLALATVLAGVLLALLVRAVVLHYGLKVTRRIPTDLDDELLRLGAGVVVLVIIYTSLMAAARTLPLNETVDTLVTRVLASLLVFQLMRVGFRASYIGLMFLSRVKDRFQVVEERTMPLFDLVGTILIVAIGAYALFEVWEIDPTAWLASAGVIGIAVGFAAKDTLANLFAGFFIIADAPYKKGDYVLLDSGERGEISKVGVRSTRMLTRDDVEIIIPNSLMANQKIVNESTGRWVKSRIRLKVGVAYGSDVDQVMQVLLAVPPRHDIVSKDPEPRVRLRGFGDSSLEFELLCWVNHPSERGLVSHELYLDIYQSLRREGIEIPFPQRDVWVRKVPEAAMGEKGDEGADSPA